MPSWLEAADSVGRLDPEDSHPSLLSLAHSQVLCAEDFCGDRISWGDQVAASLLPIPGLGHCVCVSGKRNQVFRKSKKLGLPTRKLWDTQG